MDNLLTRKVLVLNKNWAPLSTITLKDAIIKTSSTYADGTPKARIIDHRTFQSMTWQDWTNLKPSMTDEVISGSNISLRILEIIVLTRFEKLPRPRAHFNRRTLYKRDNQLCQYCGCRPPSDEWSIDHIHPISKGGLTTWENCVTCCLNCNRKKGCRTLKQANMTLLKEPKKPHPNMLRFNISKPIKSWIDLLGEAFWNVELENDNI